MKLYLMRHGQTDWNVQKLAQGRTDIPLNAEGRRQALENKHKVDALALDACVTSPLMRARQTAEIVVDGRVPIIESELLVERCFGDREGGPVSELRSDDWDPRLNISDRGIEPVCDMLARAAEFLDWLREQPYQSVLISSHGTFLKAIYYTIVGYDDDTDFFSWHLENGEIEEMEI